MINSSPYVLRPTYGPTRLGSSVGIDPTQYRTKTFTQELSTIADYLKNLVSTYKVTGFDDTFNHSFNHCTVLIYRSNDDSKSNSSLSFHCDSTYDTNGNFKSSGNTQLVNSLVSVLTLGDSRQLNFKLRTARDNKWIVIDREIPCVHLPHNSLFDSRSTHFIHSRRSIDFPQKQYGIIIQWLYAIEKLHPKQSVTFDIRYTLLQYYLQRY